MKNVNELLDEYFVLKKQITDLQTQQDFVKSQLKLLLEVEGVESLDGEKGYVFIQTRKSTSFDRDKLKELLKEDYNGCLKESVSSFVMVKEK